MSECGIQLPNGCLSRWYLVLSASAPQTGSKEQENEQKLAAQVSEPPTTDVPEGISVIFGKGFKADRKETWEAIFHELIQKDEWKSTGLTDLMNPRYDEFSFLPPSEGKVSSEGLAKAISILSGCGFMPLSLEADTA
ncbi:unnamed protein product [Clonostachys rosea f. rosea IK726]|uniref:Uncharacterized protein n=1 Tax=Clonostachys rosea f. rosea IK726 TaxID=1349383 RepID=A0ACA9TZC3_BIOOC|nr:unnamed protein product [Clonostachys rosea f. rosea IK726]